MLVGHAPIQGDESGNMNKAALSITTIVMMAIVLLVLLVLAALFSGTTTEQMSKTEATRIFYTGCNKICPYNETYKAAFNLAKDYPQFYKACLTLGYGSAQFPSHCMLQCNCDMRIDKKEVEEEEQRLIEILAQVG